MARVVSAAPIVAALYRQLRDDEEAFAAQDHDGVGAHVLREHEIRLAQLRAGYPLEVPGSLIPPSSLPPIRCAGMRWLVVYPNGRVESVNREVSSGEFLYANLGEGDGSVTDFAEWLHRTYYAAC